MALLRGKKDRGSRQLLKTGNAHHMIKMAVREQDTLDILCSYPSNLTFKKGIVSAGINHKNVAGLGIPQEIAVRLKRAEHHMCNFCHSLFSFAYGRRTEETPSMRDRRSTTFCR